MLFQVSFLCVLLFSVLTLKALAKDWKASLLLLNLALCYHQHKLTEHAERDALASEKRFVFSQKWTWCRDVLLQEKLEHLVEVQEFAVTKFSHDKLTSDNSVFAHAIIKHYQTFKGTQPHNGYFFRHFELFYKAFFHLNLSESPSLTHRLNWLASILHLHISLFLLMAIWSHWFTLSYMLALDLSSCWKCENSQTVQAIFILSVSQQNNFCLCCDK